MKKLFKILLYTFGTLFVLLLLAALLHPFFLGPTIRKAVTTIGPMVTKTPVTLEDVSVNLFSGNISLKGLVVGNPDGFKTEAAMKLAEVRLSVDPLSVFSKTIHVKQVYVDGAEAWYEAGIPDSNVGKLQKNIDAFTGGAKPAAKPEEKKPAGEGKKVVIDDLQILNTKVHLSVKGLGGAALPVPMPDIKQKDIGKEGDGKTVAQAAADILKSVTDGIAEVGTKAIGGLKDGAKAIGGAAADAGKGALDAGKSAVDSVKGLFGGGSKK